MSTPKPSPVPRLAQPVTTRAAHLDALNQEIRAEMAASLGRVAAKLDQRLALLADVSAELDGLPAEASPQRSQIQARYRQLREEAEEYRFYLIVQREAMGLRNHDELMRLYPLPPRLAVAP